VFQIIQKSNEFQQEQKIKRKQLIEDHDTPEIRTIVNDLINLVEID